jgi:hypothetical protein
MKCYSRDRRSAAAEEGAKGASFFGSGNDTGQKWNQF